MELFAPKYYSAFRCIADRCRYSCCIGWEIGIDSESLSRYLALGGEVSSSIELDRETGEAHFCLDENERCPHLDEKGLCRLILAHGEGMLCEICREHPRFYHRASGRLEVGLGMACEEAARLILSSPDYSVTAVTEGDGEPSKESDFDARALRDEAYRIIGDGGLAYGERLKRLALRFGVALPRDAVCRELLSELEYLREADRASFVSAFSREASECSGEEKLVRALAYFLYRHLSPAESEEEAREAVALALFLERAVASLARSGMPLEEAARLVSEELEYSEENTAALRSALAGIMEE